MTFSIMVLTVSPEDCDPPHSVSRPDQVIDLANEFVQNGWDETKPRLIAYPWNKKLQLLSGSHRWAAAKMVGISIPVVVISTNTVDKTWGTEGWNELMQLGRFPNGWERA